MRVSLSTLVRGIDPDAAAAWWSDFRDGETDHAMMPGYERRIVARHGDSVAMVDETRWLGVRVFSESTTAWPSARAVRFRGTNNFASFEGAYRFDAADGGTRITLEAAIELRRGLGWTDVAAKPLVLAILRADLAHHAKDLRRSLIGC